METKQDSERVSWLQTWMAVAEVMARRSLCSRRQIGAVIVSSQNRQIAGGYNSPPRGFPHQNKFCVNYCLRSQIQQDNLQPNYSDCVSVHAEMNALLQVDNRHYLQNGSIFVTAAMCWDCAKVIANTGLLNVYMKFDGEGYSHRDPEKTINFLRKCGLRVVALSSWQNVGDAPGRTVRGGRITDPGLDAICSHCNQPRRQHGGPTNYGACPGQRGLYAKRFSMKGGPV